MKNIIFYKVPFLKTIGIFLILSVVWTIISLKIPATSIIGFLIILSISFFFGQNIKGLRRFVLLTISIFIIFFVTTFVVGGFLIEMENGDNLISIISSLFIPYAMITLLNRVVRIDFKILTFVLAFLFLLLAYFYLVFNNYSYTYQYNNEIDNNIDFLIMFSVFQFLMIIPLTLGMTLKKAVPNH